MHKCRSEYRDGYKAHIAVEPETGLITAAAALTPANTAESPTRVGLLAGEEPGLEVLGDSAYGSGETRADLRAADTPRPSSPSPCGPPSRVASPRTTSASTSPRAR